MTNMRTRWLAPLLEKVVASWVPQEHEKPISLASLVPFRELTAIGMALAAAALVVSIVCEFWLRPARAPRTGTWDCGYARPSARMQYTSSSFADTLVRLFRGVLRPDSEPPEIKGLFPPPSRFRSITEDVVLFRFILPMTRSLKRLAGRMRVIQRGQMRNYVVYIFATVVVLLVWTFPVGRWFVRLLTR